MTEREVICESHIDFTEQHIVFTIYGTIEIDGHQFKNHKSKSPIIFKADLSGVVLIDTVNNIRYDYRKCSREGCNVIHLVKYERGTLFFTPDNQFGTPFLVPCGTGTDLKPK